MHFQWKISKFHTQSHITHNAGRPKGVVLPHAALHTQSLCKLAVVGYSPTDTYLHLAPLFHIGGLSSALACFMSHSSHIVLPRYSPAAALQLIRQYGVTAFIAVPTILRDLAAAWGGGMVSQQAPEPLRTVTKVLLGAGATSPQLRASDMLCYFICHLLTSG